VRGEVGQRRVHVGVGDGPDALCLTYLSTTLA
jgi:hypothetical protein